MTATGRERVPGLDGLRGVAILLVVLSHTGISLFFGAGQGGVILFFALSGFLISGLLLEQVDRRGHIDFRGFYGRRALRLGPALLVMLTVSVLLAALLHRDQLGAILKEVPYVLLYVANWRAIQLDGEVASPLGGMWSLAVEEQFYIVWPLLLLLAARRVKGRRLVLLLLGGAALALLWRFKIVYHGDLHAHFRAYFGTDTNLGALLGGAAVAAATRDGWRPPPRTASILVLAGLAAFALGALTGRLLLPYTLGAGLGVPVSIGAVLLVAGVPRVRVVARTLDLPPLRYLGRVSYGWYLWQAVAFWLLPHSRTGLWAAVAVGLAAAAASWHLVERPLLERRRSSVDRLPVQESPGLR